MRARNFAFCADRHWIKRECRSQVEVHCLCGRRPKHLQPAMPRSPCAPDGNGEIQAPRKQPDQVKTPEQRGRQLVVVVREALSEKAQNMLVDEIEVEESVNVSRRRNVADRMSMIRIAQPGENMPRRCDRKKQKTAGKDAEFPPAPPLSRKNQIRDYCGEKEYGCDEALRQYRQRQAKPT